MGFKLGAYIKSATSNCKVLVVLKSYQNLVPNKIITVSIQTDVNMSRDGNADPTASVHIWSVGVFDAERNKGYSKPFIDYLSDQLNIPTERLVLASSRISLQTGSRIGY